MSYTNLTINNKNFIKKFSHNKRFKILRQKLNRLKNKKINFLDFGAGDGQFIKELILSNYLFNFTAYEPVQKQVNEMKENFHSDNINNCIIYNNIQFIKKKFDIICCLETLEHFSKKDQMILLNQIKNLIKPNGTVFISVPLEVYLSGFTKNIFRILMGQKHPNTNIENLFKTLFGIKINCKIKTRQKLNYISSHIGFY
jgi:2-polyprenyl-3-methyl-5-hydroxy-6-metoxy-1,4-benzoquinol methylase